ncbi:MAG TPA: hypothetical protein VGL44_17475 [Gaiellales bacterium]|jgi:hypothetical protein
MQRLGGPPRNSVPFLALAIVLAILAAFVVGNGVARVVLGLAAVGALAAALARWKASVPRYGDDPEEYRRRFGDSTLDARTQVDPQVGMRPIDTTRDH